MFSITTIASSTTNPVAIARAIRERLSRLYPARYITLNVPMSETGYGDARNHCRPDISQKDENDKNDEDDRETERDLDIVNRLRESSSSVKHQARSIAGEIEARKVGNIARTRSAVAMMLAPGSRNMMIGTAGLPLTETECAHVFDGVRNTSATSDS